MCAALCGCEGASADLAAQESNGADLRVV